MTSSFNLFFEELKKFVSNSKCDQLFVLKSIFIKVAGFGLVMATNECSCRVFLFSKHNLMFASKKLNEILDILDIYYLGYYWNNRSSLRPAILLKKRLWHGCFPVNFAKFLRTPFFCRAHLVAASEITGTLILFYNEFSF